MFKKPVNVYCEDMVELGRLLKWLREQSGIVYASRNTWEVQAILPGLLDDDGIIKGFWVKVPYELASPRIKKLSEQEAFSDILHR
jgi:hypothetical protein